MRSLLKIWQSTQRELENLPTKFIEKLEHQKDKKGVAELNLFITKLKETVLLGKFNVSMQIHSSIFLREFTSCHLIPITTKFLFRYKFQKNVQFHL